MFLIDDIALFPVKGLLWVFKEIGNAVDQELKNEADNITVQLSELYMMLETGQISEEEFDAREKELLDRLDEFQDNDSLLDGDEEIEDEDELDE